MKKKLKKEIFLLMFTAFVFQQVFFPVGVYALEMPYQPYDAYQQSEFYSKLSEVELSGNQREDLVNVALSQAGYHEGDSTAELDGVNLSGAKNYTEYGYWFGTQVKGNTYGHFYDWCAMFVSWCARQAGISTTVISNSAYANSSGGAYCFNNLEFFERTMRMPQEGDLIFFDCDGLSDSWDHVGIVLSSDENNVYTIEGNAENSVKERIYALTDPVIRGYGVPDYSSDVQSDKRVHPVYNKYTPLKSYPCVGADFEVKKSDYTTRAGEIYTTDFCTINAIYEDNWCKVTFPLDSGGTITGYTPIENFIFDLNYESVSYTASEQITVCPKNDLQQTETWWIAANDTFLAVSEYGDAIQVIYEIAPEYGGGYKLGWISKENLPQTPLPAETVKGDADGDGSVTDWDAILINRYLAGWQNTGVNESAADYDGDGNVTDWDAILLERSLAGWEN